MSDVKSLITILGRVNDKLEHCTDTTYILSNIFNKWADFEIQYATNLKTLIPQTYDEHDPFVRSIIQYLQFEITALVSDSQSIKEKIIPLAKKSAVELENSKRSIHKIVSSNLYDISQAWKTVSAARTQILQAQQALPTLPPRKQPAQEKYISKLIAKSQKPESNFSTTLIRIGQDSLVSVHNDFMQVELNRLKTEREIALNFTSQTNRKTAASKDKIERIVDAYNNIDLEDNVHRYVERVFNPNVVGSANEEDIEVYGYATADFTSEDPRDLCFKCGDKIRIRVMHSSGWWEGELHKKRGYFPSTYVMVPREKNDSNVAINAVFLVNSDYTPVRIGDMPLLAGDLVAVDFIDHGRCSGKNLRNGKIGYFSINVLSISK